MKCIDCPDQKNCAAPCVEFDKEMEAFLSNYKKTVEIFWCNKWRRVTLNFWEAEAVSNGRKVSEVVTDDNRYTLAPYQED